MAPKELVPLFLKVYHDLPLSGHAGFEKTYDRIKRAFVWNGMADDVRKYVNACVPCAQRKTSPHTKPAPLQKFAIPPRPFYRIAMDVVGPLPITNSGNRYILTVQDALADLGTNFTSKLMERECEVLQIKHLKQSHIDHKPTER